MTASTSPLREIFCVVDDLYRDLAVARDVCAGRFTNCGVTLAVDPPDWRNVAIYPDREWWIEWSKFYFGLDLAFAFSVTGDQQFARVWQSLVTSWIAEVPVEFGPTDALARRLQNWIYAWDRLNRSSGFDGFDARFERRLVETLSEQAAYLQTHLTPERNHRTLELYALFTVALALPEIDPNGSRLEFAWRELHANLLSDCRPDGIHREHSTHYHMIALRSWVGARENARRVGLPIPASYDERLNRAVEFAMHCQRPDGTIPALSDSDTGDYRQTLALAARLLERPDVEFAATNGRSGAAPSLACPAFEHGGYYVQRNPWSTLGTPGAPLRHLVFDCGALGDGGHGHYDLLSIDAWAGRPLVVDPGRFTYAEGTPNWRHWFKSTSAHNTVCVDALDQTAYRCGKPRTPPATADVVTLLDAPGFNVVGAHARSSQYDATHWRHVFFIAKDYWVVVDELEGERAHDYDLRYNLGSEAYGHTRIDGRVVVAPAVDLLFDGPGELALENGWVSPTYGVKLRAPIASLRVTGLATARFVTVLLPCDTSRTGHVALTAEDTASGELCITVSEPVANRFDRLVLVRDGKPFVAGDRRGTSSIAWTRTTGAGELVAFVAGTGRQLSAVLNPASHDPSLPLIGSAGVRPGGSRC